MDTPHPNERVKYCPICRCKTWTDVDGECEWADMHKVEPVDVGDELHQILGDALRTKHSIG